MDLEIQACGEGQIRARDTQACCESNATGNAARIATGNAAQIAAGSAAGNAAANAARMLQEFDIKL